MSDKILFSIGIPAYKSKFLKECIDSILTQTCEEFELIIINDFSPDPIDEIVAAYQDRRIRYFKNQKNIGAEGVVDNWNRCLSLASGDFFVLMGDDDSMQKNYLEEFQKLILKYPKLDVYHCRSKYIDEASVAFGLSQSCPEYETTHNYLWHCFSSKRDQFVSDFVYRSSVLKEKNGFYKMPLAWTSDFLTAFIMSGDKGIAYIHLALLNYRFSSYNITATGSLDLKRQATISFENWVRNFLKDLPNNEEDRIIYPLLRQAFNKACREHKRNFIRQNFQVNGISGLMHILTNKRSYQLNLKDIIDTIAIALINHLVEQKKTDLNEL
ncbi:glycosyltransferase [Segetibacter sp. 3557_3]|uniref:glycosyltransferase family 2 protein n=1 Tax=Segetibacter sp. 3557_3 TaxID=2547429 RepID=UPI00105905AD|nr:glycosyltransferase family 2 protein [Segetibacter sp. 3557_3]TDH24634.1 glycosyltransferase [Segetibacter sp. 3557_3]